MLKKDFNQESINNNLALVKEVIEEYVEERMSVEKIAILHELSQHTVRTILLDNNIQMRPKNSR